MVAVQLNSTYTPPPLGRQHHCPPRRLSSSQTDVLKAKRSKEGLQLKLPPARRPCPTTPYATCGNVPSMPPLLWYGLASMGGRGREGADQTSQKRKAHTPLFSHPSRSTAGGRGTPIHLKKKYVPGAFIPSTFQ